MYLLSYILILKIKAKIVHELNGKKNLKIKFWDNKRIFFKIIVRILQQSFDQHGFNKIIYNFIKFLIRVKC
ncbi:MAG: hypothetical protein CEE43_09440 [Promethearchaeota archaeon Loki_b32]|nr:MAG: hypothetical protein CEE43_09440 [Candidatus Lokiarchaeota archaeon Loki_b32]